MIIHVSKERKNHQNHTAKKYEEEASKERSSTEGVTKGGSSVDISLREGSSKENSSRKGDLPSSVITVSISFVFVVRNSCENKSCSMPALSFSLTIILFLKGTSIASHIRQATQWQLRRKACANRRGGSASSCPPWARRAYRSA